MTTPDIERHLHNGRALVGTEDPDGEDVMGWPQVAYEAIRAINHLTSHEVPIPAPVMYTILGELTAVAHALPQGLRQLGHALAASLDSFDVCDHGRPEDSVAAAVAALEQAAALSARLGATLETAQRAIAEQGYTPAGRR